MPNVQMRSQPRELLCAKGNWAASRNGVQKVLHAAQEGEEGEEGVAVIADRKDQMLIVV